MRSGLTKHLANCVALGMFAAFGAANAYELPYGLDKAKPIESTDLPQVDKGFSPGVDNAEFSERAESDIARSEKGKAHADLKKGKERNDIKDIGSTDKKRTYLNPDITFAWKFGDACEHCHRTDTFPDGVFSRIKDGEEFWTAFKKAGNSDKGESDIHVFPEKPTKKDILKIWEEVSQRIKLETEFEKRGIKAKILESIRETEAAE